MVVLALLGASAVSMQGATAVVPPGGPDSASWDQPLLTDLHAYFLCQVLWIRYFGLLGFVLVLCGD